MPCGYTAAATERHSLPGGCLIDWEMFCTIQWKLSALLKQGHWTLACWIQNPFSGSSSHHLPTSEQESLIEIATNGSLKMELNQKSLPDFWIALCAEYPALANVRLGSPLSLAWKLSIGTNCVENDLRLKLSHTTQNCGVMCVKSSTPFTLI